MTTESFPGFLKERLPEHHPLGSAPIIRVTETGKHPFYALTIVSAVLFRIIASGSVTRNDSDQPLPRRAARVNVLFRIEYSHHDATGQIGWIPMERTVFGMSYAHQLFADIFAVEIGAFKDAVLELHYGHNAPVR